MTDDQLFERYWAGRGLPQDGVAELLDVVERLFGVPRGLLRADDPIEMLVGAPAARNWWRDHFHDFEAGERSADLESELALRRTELGVSSLRNRVRTFDELVLAWCGRDIPTGEVDHSAPPA